MAIFKVKSSIILCKLSQIFFSLPVYNFVIFVATKKGRTTHFFPPLSFVAVFGFGIRDGQKSGSWMFIPDLQQ
jgi:hypothetical protein